MKSKTARTNTSIALRKYGIITRFFTALLLLCLISTNTFAAAGDLKGLRVFANELRNDIRYSFLANGFFAFSVFDTLFGSTKKDEGNASREFDRIRVLPSNDDGKLSILQGETVNFSAVAYRGAGDEETAVSGVGFQWTIAGAEGENSRSLANGNFRATKIGSFRVTATAQGRAANVLVTVSRNDGYRIGNILRKSDEERTERERQFLQRLHDRGEIWTREIDSRGDYDQAAEAKLHQQDLERRAVIAAQQEVIRRAEAEGRPPVVRPGASGKNEEQMDEQDEQADADKFLGPAHGPSASSKGVPKAKSSKRKGTVAPMFRPPDDDGWDGSDWFTADDPVNAVGKPNGSAPASGAGNGNFSISAPVLSLPGRGIDVNLALTYNARLWNKSGTVMKYDSDKGYPAPGWNLGFGKMIYMGTTGGCMLVTADGTRRSNTGTNNVIGTAPTYYHNYIGKTTDNSFIDYSCTYNTAPGGTTFTGEARLANGTKIQYSSPSASYDQIYPTKITDSQGNYILITYKSNQGPKLDTVTDTLARVITFLYDTNGNLSRVEGPGYNGTTRTFVRLSYDQKTLDYDFASPLTTDTATDTPYLLKAIYYPDTEQGLWFGDNDSYSDYGMIAKVIQSRGMTHSNIPPNAPGNTTKGTAIRTQTYNFPMAANNTLTDAPNYSTHTEEWDKMDTAPVVTSFARTTSSGNEIITVTRPDGAVEKQTSNSGGYYFENEVISGSTTLSKTTTYFGSGDYSTSRPTNIYSVDSLGQISRTEFTYGANYNQVSAQKEYTYAGSVYRQTKYTYETNAAYTNRHIFSLVKSVEVTDSSTNKFSKTDYQYDNNAVVNGTSSHGLVQIDQTDPADEIVMHDYTSDPWTDEQVSVEGDVCVLWEWNYSECTYEWQEVGYWEDGNFIVTDHCHETCSDYENVLVSAYDPNSIFRGNLTRVTTYSDAVGPSGAEISDYTYDIAGNQRTATTNCCEEMSFEYTSATQYSQPESVTKGSPNPASPHRMTQTATYDFDTSATKTTTDFNGQTTTLTYDAVMRPYLVTGPTGAKSTTDYGDDDGIVIKTVQNSDNSVVSKTQAELNGRGQPVVSAYFIDGTDRNETAIEYDEMGRQKKVSMPYLSSSSPSNWTEYTYDHLSRATEVEAPDGSTSKTFFNELQRPDSATNLAGQTVRSQDAWGRERWARTDDFGRLVEVVEPNPSGSAMSTSINAARSNVGATATASSSRANHAPSTAIDGLRHTNNNWNVNGGWDSVGNSTISTPEWIEIDFNQSRNISKIDVFTLANTQNYNSDPTLSDTFTLYGIRDFKVQYWDGSAWTDIANVTSNNKVWRQFTFTAVTTNKIRVFVTGVPGPSMNARIVEVEAWTEPQSISATGSVFDPGSMRTEYTYDRLDQLTQITQGSQTRSFKYDSLGYLTRQKLAEQTATINDAGQYVGAGGTGAIWSDSFSYDGRGNLIQRTDARGVKTNFSYEISSAADPLNRLHGISYDKTTADTTYTIHDAPDVSIGYMSTGDKSRVETVTTSGVSLETNTYDGYGRVSNYQMKPLSRASYPLDTTYTYDSAGRIESIEYPKQYGITVGGKVDPRKLVEPTYDMASRLTRVEVNANTRLKDFVYNASGQVTQLKTSTGNLIDYIEDYGYDGTTGLLTSQSVTQEDSSGFSTVNTTLMDLSYGYNRGNSVGSLNGKTGQLTHIIDNLNRNKDRVYESDALGRLMKAKGGMATGTTGLIADWTQDYSYDRYGNKTGTTKTGITADSNPVPLDGLASLGYASASNRINTSGWEYDSTGNQVRGQNDAGVWLKFEYDEAGRKVQIKDDANNVLETFTYGASRNRLRKETSAGRTYYAWGGQAVIAEFFETASIPEWTKNYIYAGSRLVSTITNNSGTEVEEFHHPDRLGTRLVTNPNTGGYYEQATLPFGTALAAESSGFSNQIFTSYDRSVATGVDYAVNRPYSSGQSRFAQVDPIGMASASLGNPQSNNLFSYVQNMPNDFVDPSGLNEDPPIFTEETWVPGLPLPDSFWRFFWWRMQSGGGRGVSVNSDSDSGGVGGNPPPPDHEAWKKCIDDVAKRFANPPGTQAELEAFDRTMAHARENYNIMLRHDDEKQANQAYWTLVGLASGAVLGSLAQPGLGTVAGGLIGAGIGYGAARDARAISRRQGKELFDTAVRQIKENNEAGWNRRQYLDRKYDAQRICDKLRPKSQWSSIREGTVFNP